MKEWMKELNSLKPQTLKANKIDWDNHCDVSHNVDDNDGDNDK